MTQPIASSLLVFLIVGVGVPGFGQASAQENFDRKPAAERQMIAIHVIGSKRFPEAAIAAATGLQLATAVTEEDFKRAARRLGDEGAFTEIGYTYSYSSGGTKLELHVTDAQQFVPAHFEDFVWFSDADLRRRIKEHVPLFDGELPLSGHLADEVSDVLQAMLVEGAIPGHVDYVRAGKQDGPVESIDYKVTNVLIRVGKIEFTGAGAAELPALEAAAEGLADREYSRSRLDLFAQRQLLPIYHERGYLKASFGEPQPKVVPGASTTERDSGPANESVVDITFAVTPGQQYKLAKLEWSSNQAFPTETLGKMVHAEPGQPANLVRLNDDLKSVQELYGTRGFVTTTIKANAEFNDAASTVVIDLVVIEGSVYHMGDLEFRGLDNGLTSKLRNAWKIRPGDVYDASYLSEYLPEAHKLLPATLDWDVSSHVTANIKDKTVDVDLIYSVRAPK